MILFFIKLTWMIIFLLFGYYLLFDFARYDTSIAIFVLFFRFFYNTLAFIQRSVSFLSCVGYYMMFNQQTPAQARQFRDGFSISCFVWPSEVNLFLEMQNQSYTHASHRAILCMFGNSGFIDYFYYNRCFAAVFAHKENFLNSLWIFSFYDIHTKLFFWDHERFYFHQIFLGSDGRLYYDAMLAVKTYEESPAEMMQQLGIDTGSRPPLTPEFEHFILFVTGNDSSVPTRGRSHRTEYV